MDNKLLINGLMKLSRNMNSIAKLANESIVKRKRKTNAVDSIAFRLLYGQNSVSQNIVTARLNDFRVNKNKATIADRSSFIERENKIKIEIYEDLIKELDSHINTLKPKNQWNSNVYAIDGSLVNMIKQLQNEGFPKTSNNEYCSSGYIFGIYNITTEIPINISLLKSHNERKAYIDFFNKKDNYKDSIFTFDRGYWSNDLYKFVNSKEFKYAFRISERYNIVTDKEDDVIDHEGYKVRVIRYSIGNQNYYIATNLFDTTIGDLKSLYHSRWKIEEFFKYIKSNMKLAHMKEQNSISLMKCVYCQLIIAQIVHLIKYYLSNDNTKYTNANKINKRVLTDGMYTAFILPFIYNKGFTKTFIKNFLLIYIQSTHCQIGKHYERISHTPYTKWNRIVSRCKKKD